MGFRFKENNNLISFNTKTMENGKLTSILTFVVGLAIGSYWPTLKKYIPKIRKKGEKMVETVIEDVEEKAGEVAKAAKNIAKKTKVKMKTLTTTAK